MEKHVGDWIEIDEKIYEIEKELSEHYILREVLYREPTPVLKYSDSTTAIRKEEAPENIVINPEDAELDALIDEVIDEDTVDE